MNAVEDLLVSLYGAAQPSAKVHHTEEQPCLKTSNASTNDLQNPTVKSKDVWSENPTNVSVKTNSKTTKETHKGISGDALLHCQASNSSSSSSSVAEDWIVNQIPENISICEDATYAKEANPERNSSENRDKDAFSAEEWSRGTALRDPDSDKPLQPVKILTKDGEKNIQSPPRQLSNAVTEKRAALTAYDVLANRVVRAPLSPTSLFEKETRAQIVSENPKAGLHQINAAVQERWKTLSQEERQK